MKRAASVPLATLRSQARAPRRNCSNVAPAQRLENVPPALNERRHDEDFESFVRKRHSAVFFSAALFASVVIDAQLRNNIDMIVTLGDWVRSALRAFLPGESSTWQVFFKD